MTNVLLYLLIPLAMLGTVVALGFGIYALGRGGEFNKRNSNKLMRLRVMFQGIALALLALLVVILQTQG